MLGAYGVQARRDLYRANSAVTRGLGFCGVIRRKAQLVALYEKKWICSIYTNSGPAGLQAVSCTIFLFKGTVWKRKVFFKESVGWKHF